MRRSTMSAQDHVSRWRSSGQSVAEYCRQARISRHVLDYWRRRLAPDRGTVSDFIQISADQPSHEAPWVGLACIQLEMMGPTLRLTFGPEVEAQRIAQVMKLVGSC